MNTYNVERDVGPSMNCHSIVKWSSGNYVLNTNAVLHCAFVHVHVGPSMNCQSIVKLSSGHFVLRLKRKQRNTKHAINTNAVLHCAIQSYYI